MENKNSDHEWIEWEGGECPVDPDEYVQIICKREDLWEGVNPIYMANNVRWAHIGMGGDIVKYRVVK